jgi:cytochrome P450
MYEKQAIIREEGLFSGSRVLLATGRHDIAEEVLTDDFFQAGVGSAAIARMALHAGMHDLSMGPLDPPSLLVSDPPEHTRMRRLVAKGFTPQSVHGLEPRIVEIADRLLDELAATSRPDDPIDLVERYTKRLPVAVISDILSVPVDMLDQILRWSDQAAPSLDFGVTFREFLDADRALTQTNAWLRNHFEQLRAEPTGDLFSDLVRVSDNDPDRLSETELVSMTQLLVAAGFVTIVDMLGSGVALLLRHPDQLTALRAEPALWPNAVEEILRYDSPVQITARFSSRNQELGGRRLAKGQGVVVLLGAANRDPRVFPEPEVFDIARDNARDHMAFSRGVHHCLGSGLARLEGRIALQRLMERFPHMTLLADPELKESAFVRGYESVPVLLGREAGSTTPTNTDPVHDRAAGK